MVDPVTVNVAMIVPLTGADVDTWGEDAVNPNMVAIDGMLAGVQTVGVTTGLVTLTAPSGFTPTPSPGPTQSQNRVLRFTGTLVGHVAVLLPLPGLYVIDNRTVSGGFVLYFRAATQNAVVCVPSGDCLEIYCDGTDVYFVGLARPGTVEMWAGLSAMPSWATLSTKKPYLLCDGTVYNFSDFPALGAQLLGTYGGNGITTFAVPDLRGRVPLAYDSTGTRITTAGCGINGQTLGASGGTQDVTIAQVNLPNVNFVVAAGQTVAATGTVVSRNAGTDGAGTTGLSLSGNSIEALAVSVSGTVTSTGTAASGGSGTAVRNVQPAIVAGIYVIKT